MKKILIVIISVISLVVNGQAVINQVRLSIPIQNFGAKGDGVTDDTQAFIKAWDYSFRNGGIDIVIKNGIYIIAGPLKTNVNGVNPNCQIYAPNLGNSAPFSAIVKTRFMGQSNSQFRRGYTISHTAKIETGVVIRSTINGNGTNPSVFGGKASVGWIYSPLDFENLSIEVNTNGGITAPTMNGINGLDIATMSTRNVNVSTDVATSASPSPVSSGTFGIAWGDYSNNGPNMIEETTVTGFDYGFVFGEHTVITNSYAFACNYGFVFPKMYYSVSGFNILIHGCRYALYFPNASFLGRTAAPTTQNSIINLSIECENIVNAGAWNNFVSHLVDPGDLASGYLTYTIYNAGDANLHNDAFVIASGGTNLALRRSDSSSPFKLTPKTLLSSPKNGMLEYDGTHLYFTIGTTRTQIL